MSKVNVDEIKVGDLVGFDSYAYKGQISVGYVTSIEKTKDGCKKFWGHFGSSPMPSRLEYLNDHSVDYHWKVINFEEESKMDELKVYTGKEALQELLVGKIMNNGVSDFKFEGEDLLVKTGKDWIKCYGAITTFLECRFTEVVTPQVGDWVKVHTLSKVIIGKLTGISNTHMYANWDNSPEFNTSIGLDHDWQILSPEEVSEYKREQAFVKVGRKLNEFRSGDIVMIGCLDTVAIVISKKNEANSIIKLHGINEVGKGYDAGAHQLTPISFVEQQVDLS